MDAAVEGKRSEPGAVSRAGATFFGSIGFLILIIGLTYFAMLVLAIQYGDSNEQAASYYELGRYLSGRLEWFQNARVLSALALLCALVSVLFGAHPLGRITLPVSGAIFLVLLIWSEPIWRLITSWAKAVG